jgi:hypothetical protein
MRELIEKLNRIDIRTLFSRGVPDENPTGAKQTNLLASFGKVDRSLWVMFAIGAALLLLGLNIMLSHMGLREQRQALEADLLSLRAETDVLDASLKQLEEKHADLLELMRASPTSVGELLAAISEDMQAFGVDLVKSSTTKDPDGGEAVFFAVEGDYRPLREFINGLSSYSASFELNRLEVAVVPERGVLSAAVSLAFVRPPNLKRSSPSARYDERGVGLGASLRRVQFMPAPTGPSTSKNQVPPPGSTLPQGAQPSQGDSTGRNPFLVPPKPTQSTDPLAGKPGAGVPRQSRASQLVSRSDGLVLTGCYWSKERSSCVFETNEGKIIKVRPGENVLNNMSLISVSQKSVLLRISDRNVSVQIGDQVK